MSDQRVSRKLATKLYLRYILINVKDSNRRVLLVLYLYSLFCDMMPGTHDLEDYVTYYIPVIHLSYTCHIPVKIFPIILNIGEYRKTTCSIYHLYITVWSTSQLYNRLLNSPFYYDKCICYHCKSLVSSQDAVYHQLH